jgi:hypothetical protein
MDKTVNEGYNQNMKVLPSQKHLNRIFKYNPSTGKLTWVISPAYQVKAGDEAGWMTKMGYRRVTINYQDFPIHRVIWKMVYGVDPHHIDHINGKKGDNRIKNLRSVHHQLNTQNRPMNKNNTSGYIGVSYYKTTDKWRVQIDVNGHKKTVGYFKRKSDAVKCRKEAELKYGYHKNHGRVTQ